MQGKDRQFWMGMYTMATAGLNIVAATFIGLGIGWLLDHKVFDGATEPWLTLIFLLFGIVAGFRNMLRMVLPKGGAGGEEAGGGGVVDENDEEEEEDDEDKKGSV